MCDNLKKSYCTISLIYWIKMICLRSHAYQYVLQRLGKTVDNHNSFEFKIHCKGQNKIC